MAHNIHFNSVLGKFAAIFGNGEAAWHNLGTVKSGLLTMEEIFTETGMDQMVVEVQPFFDAIGNETGFHGVFRIDNGVCLGPCGEGYQVLQNAELFPWADSLIGMHNGAHYESAGVLGKGERIWALARVPSLDFIIGEDKNVAFLLFVSSHDGSLATTTKLTYVRVVCENTLAMGLHDGKKAIKIKHTKNMKDRMETALRLFKGTQATAMNFQERIEFLANKSFTKEHVEKVLDSLFPKKEKVEGEKVRDGKRNNILDEILELYNGNDENAFPEQAGTGYALLNAITNYVDHSKIVRNTSGNENIDRDALRAEQATFGTGATMKEQAFEIILEVAGTAPQAPYRNFIQRALDNGEAERAQEQKALGLLDLIIEAN